MNWQPIESAPKEDVFWMLCPDGSIQKAEWQYVECSDYDQMPIYDFWLPSRDEFFGCFWDGPHSEIKAYWVPVEAIPEPPTDSPSKH